MTLQDFLARLGGVKKSTGNQYSALCPAHPDNNPSLSVSTGTGKDGTSRIILNCHAGCEARDIVEALGLTMKDLVINPTPEQDFKKLQEKSKAVAWYNYTDKDGNFLYQKTRWQKSNGDKSFAWRYKDNGGNWIKGRKGEAVLYNLPVISTTEHIFVVEGEKDVETLKGLGWNIAVSPPDGAGGKWQKSYTEALRGKEVTIIQDNDDPGKAFAIRAANALHGTARQVRIIDLTTKWTNLPNHADISDLLLLYPTNEVFEALTALCINTPDHIPQEEPQEVTAKERKPLKFRRMSDIKSIPPEYLIEPYFPKGKLTIIGGVSGSTKTWFTLELAALISKGRDFYTDDEFTLKRKPGIVIYQTKENDYESDVRPRLDKLNGNLDNIIVIDDYDDDGDGFPLTLSDGRIEQAMQQFYPQLLVFDPIQSYIGAETDMNQANKVRPILDKLIDIAAKYNCTVVLVSHMSKKTDLGALDRLLGSSDIRNAARSILIVGSDPNDRECRIIAHAKNSLGQPGQSLKYHIDSRLGVVFDGYSDLEADDIVPKGAKLSIDGRKSKHSEALDEARNALEEMLGESGYIEYSQVQTYIAVSGISKSTVYKAKDELALQMVSIGFSDKKTAYWLAPDVEKESFKLEHTPQPEQMKIP